MASLTASGSGALLAGPPMLPVVSSLAALPLLTVGSLAGGRLSPPKLHRPDFPGEDEQPASAMDAIAARTQRRIRMDTPARRTAGVTQHDTRERRASPGGTIRAEGLTEGLHFGAARRL